ncbi:MAG: UDP-N-acetylmuramoyl-L-alanyl-D-glutamate--2,6-diaminopimelate ligase [Anaerolineae bacterium]|nr:UDP-N-acetylmuramoyl-L-alanyl-D-glutamate--2,6-diaminopimelate ligase [Anaerolineae bacterium]
MNNLRQILASIPVAVTASQPLPPDLEIHGATLDSRQVRPGDLFVATQGISLDSHRFIPAAVENGAVAVIGTHPIDHTLPVPYLVTPDSRLALAHIAAALYDFPARSLCMIGVTGTDGKTSTATLLYHILTTAGLPTGLITTVSAVIGEEILDTGFHVTTPEAIDVQRYLARMRDAGMTHVVLETTSHGLAQHRVSACEFDLAVVTNITHEHLDYHGSYQAYLDAKSMLFSQLAGTREKAGGNIRLAVLNRDDSSYPHLRQVSTGRLISYSLSDPSAECTAVGLQADPDGMRFNICHQGMETPITTPLVGRFNAANILAAFSAAIAGVGVAPNTAAEGIARMHGVPGRMERIDLNQDFTAIVDFAHTPNALKVALETLNQLKPAGSRLWAVFGSAGLRDREKRRMMAEVSVQLADRTILTAEDPRTESLDDILRMMARAAESMGGIEGETFWQIPDRGAAIQFAVDQAQPGDLVCAFGKGHEQSMCFITTEYPWDDRTAMRAALARRLGISGYPMPYLPTQDAGKYQLPH